MAEAGAEADVGAEADQPASQRGGRDGGAQDVEGGNKQAGSEH